MSKENKNNKSVHDGHRERLRDRFIKFGLAGMQDHEMLELLLFNSIPRKDTNEIAHKLLERFGSLINVLEARECDLVKTDGIGEVSAAFLKLVGAIVANYTEPEQRYITLNTFDEGGDYLMERYKNYENEMVSIICLNKNCNIIGWVPVLEGDKYSVNIDVKKIVSDVIDSKADAIILAHNHPHSSALPSVEDVKATLLVRNALYHVGVVLLDHVVLCDDDYVSMASSGAYRDIFTEIGENYGLK